MNSHPKFSTKLKYMLIACSKTRVGWMGFGQLEEFTHLVGTYILSLRRIEYSRGKANCQMEGTHKSSRWGNGCLKDGSVLLRESELVC